jgi:hypothetical protein
MTRPDDETIERVAVLLSIAQEGRRLPWPAHLSEVERDVWRVRAMQIIAAWHGANALLARTDPPSPPVGL